MPISSPEAPPAAGPRAPVRFGPESAPGFGGAVRERVRQYLNETGQSRFGGWRTGRKAAAWTVVVGLSYWAAVMSASVPGWVRVAAAIAFGISSLLLAINVAHDAAHFTLSRHRWVNKVAHLLTFTLLGINAHLWAQRHVRSHHVCPNVEGCDVDAGETSLLRLAPHHRRRLWHRWQHVYAPIVYMLVLPYTIFVQDPAYLYRSQIANMRGLRHSCADHIRFWVSKAAYISIVLALPIAAGAGPWWAVVGAWLASLMVTSLVFVVLLIGTHFAEETAYPQRDEQGRLPHDWAMHAVVTSLDWNPTCAWLCALVGGANAHVAHHLVPSVCHVHCVQITRIIQQAATEFRVPYRSTTFAGMIRSHFRLLRRLGRE